MLKGNTAAILDVKCHEETTVLVRLAKLMQTM